MRPPHKIANPNAIKLDFPVFEIDAHHFFVNRLHGVDVSAFFRLVRTSPIGCIKYNAIAGFDLVFKFNIHTAKINSNHLADVHASVPRSPTDDDILMIDARHKVSTKSTRVNLFEAKFLFFGVDVRQAEHRQIDRLAIGLRGHRDILFILVTSFNFQARNSDIHQVRNLLDGVKVTWRKQISIGPKVTLLSIDDQIV